MSTNRRTVILVSASPKVGEPSVSDYLVSLQEKVMKDAGLIVQTVNVRRLLTHKQTEGAYKTMREADALVFTFPLYFFCLPGMLMRFLQDYYAYTLENAGESGGPRVFAVVNCGFPEPAINDEAIRVMKSFSGKINGIFRFGVAVGGGGMFLGAGDAPFMKKAKNKLDEAFHAMAADILTGAQEPAETRYVPVNFPRILYLFMADRGWTATARKNGLKKKDLYRKPYRPE